MPTRDSAGMPSMEPRSNLGYALGVFMRQSYASALIGRSTTGLPALPRSPRPAPRPRCREVAWDIPGSCIAGEESFGPAGEAANSSAGEGASTTGRRSGEQRLNPARASVGLMERMT